ncbi:hypothetical protein [Alicyclobacillus acidocaldarius]|uniref:hypothetical protein n=1 Tax=Alicyclobacillus acidocaldarius TaxID=405212 RepID=UPI001ED8E074|nr:hypothetical protein [Alicyclobacillus acidocaldarius]
MGISDWHAHDWRWDPRSELTLDHDVWELLLTKVVDDEEIGWILNGARCAGCRLFLTDGHYRIEPTIDPKRGFDTKEDWEEFRRQWLLPNAGKITAALRKLEETERSLRLRLGTA